LQIIKYQSESYPFFVIAGLPVRLKISESHKIEHSKDFNQPLGI
jgi:hypothetical protein